MPKASSSDKAVLICSSVAPAGQINSFLATVAPRVDPKINNPENPLIADAKSRTA